MSEIEKLYINANVEKEWKPLPYGGIDEFYPEFTAEKQLELIKWLSIKYGIYIVDEYSIGFGTCIGEFCIKKNFEEVLAESINHLWQDLTEEEKAVIRGILRA